MRSKDYRNRNNVYDVVLHEISRMISDFFQKEVKDKIPDQLLLENFNNSLIQYRAEAGKITGLGVDQMPQISYFISDAGKMQVYIQGWFESKSKNMILIGNKTMRDRYYDFYVYKQGDLDILYITLGDKTGDVMGFDMSVESCQPELKAGSLNSTKSIAYQFYKIYKEKLNGWVNIGGSYSSIVENNSLI